MIEELTTLPLENSNKVVIIDKNQFENLNKYSWRLSCDGYPFTTIRGKIVRLHELITGLWPDHKDRDKLNNTRNNLRAATFQQNCFNKDKRQNTSSKYKGVVYSKRDKVWLARININKKPVHLGTFKSEIEAALAYNKSAAVYHGEFAVLNKV